MAQHDSSNRQQGGQQGSFDEQGQQRHQGVGGDVGSNYGGLRSGSGRPGGYPPGGQGDFDDNGSGSWQQGDRGDRGGRGNYGQGYGQEFVRGGDQWNDSRGASRQRDDGEFDPDYQQWRTEQMRTLDDDYKTWRKDRYKKFSDEFSQWRTSRQGQSANPAGSADAGSNAASGNQGASSKTK